MNKTLTEGEYKALLAIWGDSPTAKPFGVQYRTLQNLEDKGYLHWEVIHKQEGGKFSLFWLSDAGKLAMDEYPHLQRLQSCKSFEELIVDINAWQRKTFKKATSKSIATHLLREAKELLANPTDGDEMSDVFMLLMAAYHWAGINPVEAVRAKFAVNLAREWAEPDGDGVSEHIRT